MLIFTIILGLVAIFMFMVASFKENTTDAIFWGVMVLMADNTHTQLKINEYIETLSELLK